MKQPFSRHLHGANQVTDKVRGKTAAWPRPPALKTPKGVSRVTGAGKKRGPRTPCCHLGASREVKQLQQVTVQECVITACGLQKTLQSGWSREEESAGKGGVERKTLEQKTKTGSDGSLVPGGPCYEPQASESDSKTNKDQGRRKTVEAVISSSVTAPSGETKRRNL